MFRSLVRLRVAAANGETDRRSDRGRHSNGGDTGTFSNFVDGIRRVAGIGFHRAVRPANLDIEGRVRSQPEVQAPGVLRPAVVATIPGLALLHAAGSDGHHRPDGVPVGGHPNQVNVRPVVAAARVPEQLIRTGIEEGLFREQFQAVGHEQINVAIDVVVSGGRNIAQAHGRTDHTFSAESRCNFGKDAGAIVLEEPVGAVRDRVAAHEVEVLIHVVVKVSRNNAAALGRQVEARRDGIVHKATRRRGHQQRRNRAVNRAQPKLGDVRKGRRGVKERVDVAEAGRRSGGVQEGPLPGHRVETDVHPPVHRRIVRLDAVIGSIGSAERERDWIPGRGQGRVDATRSDPYVRDITRAPVQHNGEVAVGFQPDPRLAVDLRDQVRFGSRRRHDLGPADAHPAPCHHDVVAQVAIKISDRRIRYVRRGWHKWGNIQERQGPDIVDAIRERRAHTDPLKGAVSVRVHQMSVLVILADVLGQAGRPHKVDDRGIHLLKIPGKPAVNDREVQLAVARKVEPHGQPAGPGNVLEGVVVDAVHQHAVFVHQKLAGVAGPQGNKQIRIAIVVPVAPGPAVLVQQGNVTVPDVHFPVAVFEGAVALVDVDAGTPPVVIDEDVGQAVRVHVAPGGTE